MRERSGGQTPSPSLVFIYGPPAAGKLTVARALAELTGHKVLHNHMLFDFAGELVPPFSEPFLDLMSRVRLGAVEVCMRAGVSLVMTMVFSDPEDLPFMSQVDEAVKGGGGQLFRVHLCPGQAALERRVLEASRAEYGKLRDVEGLREALERWNVYSPVDEGDLAIDNTDLSPSMVAAKIQGEFGLQE